MVSLLGVSLRGTESPIIPEVSIMRGDISGDGVIDLTDQIILLDFLYVTGKPISCMKAADVNDDGEVDLTDCVIALRFLYVGDTNTPCTSFGVCCPDETPDLLTCEEYTFCGP